MAWSRRQGEASRLGAGDLGLRLGLVAGRTGSGFLPTSGSLIEAPRTPQGQTGSQEWVNGWGWLRI